MTAFTRKLTAAVAALVVTVVIAAAPVPKQPPAGRTADARQRAHSKNNLKQIILALHSYHDANGNLPRNVVNKDGKPLLSWRVLILPYIEQAALYNEFKLDEPWDSDNNKKLLAKMPDVFRVGFEEKGETKTYYQGFAGPGTVFDPGRKITLLAITDGTSNTLAVVEAGPPVEWTKPEDLPYPPKNALPKLDGPFTNTLIVGAADGAVYTLRRDIEEKVMRRLIETADGEVVSFDELRGKFLLTAEDVKAAQTLLKDNEKLIGELTEEFKKQQKLFADAIKKLNAADVKAAQELIKENEKSIGELAEELKKQQQLFADAIKKPSATVDLDKLATMSRDLRLGLAELKRETEEMKRHLEGESKPAVPPAPKK